MTSFLKDICLLESRQLRWRKSSNSTGLLRINLEQNFTSLTQKAGGKTLALAIFRLSTKDKASTTCL